MKMKKVVSTVLALIVVFAMTAPAFAANPSEVTVQGFIVNQEDDPDTIMIGDPDDPQAGTYDITMPATVYWWVTETTEGNVVNGDANGPTSATDPYEISNNNSSNVSYTVSLASFDLVAGDAETIKDAGTLTLNLTGDLAEGTMAGENLDDGYTGPFDYSATLDTATAGTGAWSYGFTGTYTGPVTISALEPEYTMTLGFDFA